MLHGANDTGRERLVCRICLEFEALQRSNAKLELVADGCLKVTGPLTFTAEFGDRAITDTYDIEIQIPSDYPAHPPRVWETGGRIARNFHRNPPDLDLCLGPPVVVRKKFAQEPTLSGFIDRLLVPFLYFHTHTQRFGKPFQDLRHGIAGLVQFYSGFFGVSPRQVPAMLSLLCIQAPPAQCCPCGSGLTLSDCHAAQLDELRPYLAPKEFESELTSVKCFLGMATVANEKLYSSFRVSELISKAGGVQELNG